MSESVIGSTWEEPVFLFFIDKTPKPSNLKWEGFISDDSPLIIIFQKWVNENHPGSPVGQYSNIGIDPITYPLILRFTLDNEQGRPLNGTETCKELDIHSGRKIYANV
uniref:Uncharacterized protein n=1 Tax=Kwoniella pini CBS 10737 TaxID=1296096 RepID=A0A1B9I7D6_9TREE|nr:uncharacterized protein I206_02184 [Kwoniella pini CBS 10737]OCF51470.1 hypothetical protein I206_02184 [Kwoniella pini CBS 10737]